MSRIGKKAVTIPTGVTANVEGQTVKMKGPKGALQVVLHDDVTAKMDKGAIQLEPRSETKRARSLWGTSRTLVANLVAGVTKGFEEKLEINGVGFRAAVQGKQLNLQLGFSHDINYRDPARASRSRRRSRPKSWSPASTSSRSARLPPSCAASGRPSPTRARA